MPVEWRDSCRRLLWVTMLGIILAAVGIKASYLFCWATQNLWAESDTSYGESAVVERALAVAKGESLYEGSSHWPYHAAPYGPLAYSVPGIVSRAIGLPEGKAMRAQFVYLVGRLLSFAAGLGILLWIWWASGALGLNRSWRLIAVLLVTSSKGMLTYWATCRPDYPMAALDLWAWAFLIGRGGYRRVFASVLLFTLAISFKQSALLSAAGLGVWLIVEKRRTDAILFAFLLLLSIGLVAGGLYVVTSGAWWDDSIHALAGPLSIASLSALLFGFGVMEIFPLAGGLASCLGGLDHNARARPFTWGFALSFVVAEVAVLRLGSDINYYMEAYAWGCVLTAACLAQVLTRMRSAKGLSVWIPEGASLLFVSILALPFLSTSLNYVQALPRLLESKPTWMEANRPLVERLGRTQGEVLLSEGRLFWLTQSPPTMMDPMLFTLRVEAGSLSPAELLVKIRKADFEIIVLGWKIGDPPPSWQGLNIPSDYVIQCISERYRLSEQLGGYYLYTPIPAMSLGEGLGR